MKIICLLLTVNKIANVFSRFGLDLLTDGIVRRKTVVTNWGRYPRVFKPEFQCAYWCVHRIERWINAICTAIPMNINSPNSKLCWGGLPQMSADSWATFQSIGRWPLKDFEWNDREECGLETIKLSFQLKCHSPPRNFHPYQKHLKWLFEKFPTNLTPKPDASVTFKESSSVGFAI